MAVERELKFADVEFGPLREKLLDMEAEREWASALEDNWILDKEGEMLASGCLLRLRKDARGAWITYKGPPRFEGHTKLRDESEVQVSDPAEALTLFEGLGYRVARRYQKMRERWRVGGVSITLDHTPIGDYAEFEGDAAEALAKRCGFDPGRAERRNYLRLYDDHLREHPNAGSDMLFQQE